MDVDFLKETYMGFTIKAWAQATADGFGPVATIARIDMPENEIEVRPPTGAVAHYPTQEMAAGDALLWSKDVIDKLIEVSRHATLH